MTILMLLDRQFPPDIRVENEALSLLRQGHTVHVLSYNFSGKPKTETYKGITIHRFTIWEQVAKKSLGLIFVLPIFRMIWLRQINRLLRKHHFDAVHIHDLPLCVFAGGLSARGLKVVADMHENYPFLVDEQPFMNRFPGNLLPGKDKWLIKERSWLNKADHIICVAPEMKERLIHSTGTNVPVSVVPNTYDLRSFDEDQKELPEICERFRDHFVVSYIGGFDASRGIHLLLEAVSMLKHTIQRLHLLLVGDGSIRKELEEKAAELGILSLVTFEGWQPASHVKAYISVSSICAIPHLKSPQTDNSSPNKIFQYMYNKKPVLTSNCTSLEKIVTGEQCGLVFEDRNSKDLAEKLLIIYTDPELAKGMGKKGHQAVVDKYNWEKTVTPLIRIYEG